MILAFISTNAQSNELQGLFGLDLNKSISNYASQDFVIENSSKFSETIADYQVVYITDKTPKTNPYYSNYLVVIDELKDIQGVSGYKKFESFSTCLTQLKQIKRHFERKYQYDFLSDRRNYGGLERNREFTHTSADNYLQLECMHGKGVVITQISFRTPKLSKAISSFYNSGL